MRYFLVVFSAVFSFAALAVLAGCGEGSAEAQAYRGKVAPEVPNDVIEVYHASADAGGMVLDYAYLDTNGDGVGDLKLTFQNGEIVRVAEVEKQDYTAGHAREIARDTRPAGVSAAPALTTFATATVAAPTADDLHDFFSKNLGTTRSWTLAAKLRNCRDPRLAAQIAARVGPALRQAIDHNGWHLEHDIFILAGLGAPGRGALGNVLAETGRSEVAEKISEILATTSASADISPAVEGMIVFLEKSDGGQRYVERNIFNALANEAARDPMRLFPRIEARLAKVRQARNKIMNRDDALWFEDQVSALRAKGYSGTLGGAATSEAEAIRWLQENGSPASGLALPQLPSQSPPPPYPSATPPPSL
jgi:hypothetical protein